MTEMKTVGSRAEVMHGHAKKTSGGLTKAHLMRNKHGRIVSRKKHSLAKKEKRLVKAGYLTKKGHFGIFKKNGTRMSRKSRRRKMRGGSGGGYWQSLNPSEYNGQGVGTSGVNLQFVAGNATS
jgi:hypothetical protein